MRGMKIKSIIILKYKSIHSPLTINLQKGNLLAFIGKNGSGKSNILKAIYNVFLTIQNKYSYKRESVDFELDVILSKDEFIDIYSNGLKYNNEKSLLKIKYINSNYFVEGKYFKSNLKKYYDRFSKKLSELQNTLPPIIADLQNFIESWEKVDDIHNFNGPYLKSLEGNINYNSHVIKEIKSVVEKIYGIIMNNDGNLYNIEKMYITLREYKLEKVKIEYFIPPITPFEKKFIKINYVGIQNAINEIKNKLNKNINKINQQYKIITKIYKDIFKFIDTISLDSQDFYKRPLNLLSKINIDIWLLGENLFLFGQEKNKNFLYINTNINPNHNSSIKRDDLILRALSKICFPEKFEEITNEVQNMNKQNNENIKEYESKFQNKLNQLIPNFDKKMYDSIKVKIEEGDCNIYFVNKKEEIHIDETSSGRRWFFTYFLIKNAINSGDILLIDEPGVNLHPEAQEELLEDLYTLSNNNNILYTTHSPYLIPNFYHMYQVNLVNNETLLDEINCESIDTFDTLSDLEKNNLLLSYDKFNIIIEGKLDYKYIKSMINFLNIEKRIKLIVGNGTTYSYYAKFLDLLHVKYTVLLDADQKKKYKKNFKGDLFFNDVNETVRAIEDLMGKQEKDTLSKFSKSNKASEFVKLVKKKEISEETIENYKILFKSIGIM